MPYIALYPGNYIGRIVGDGQCVAYVKECAHAPQASTWIEGARVRGMQIPIGTAIATFQQGQYTSSTNGNSHAAIYLGQDDTAIYVLDQWTGQPVHTRPIFFKGGNDKPRNDGDAYSVIM
jgi:hypothetical protein